MSLATRSTSLAVRVAAEFKARAPSALVEGFETVVFDLPNPVTVGLVTLGWRALADCEIVALGAEVSQSTIGLRARVNGAASALTVTVGASGFNIAFAASPVAVSLGDQVDVEVTSGPGDAGPVRIYALVRRTGGSIGTGPSDATELNPRTTASAAGLADATLVHLSDTSGGPVLAAMFGGKLYPVQLGPEIT